MDFKTKNKNNEEINISWIYGSAYFNKDLMIILKEPSEDSNINEDKSVSNPIYFDQIIDNSEKQYISYITLSGIRRYSLIKDEGGMKASIQYLDKNDYKWKIFKIYKNHYIDNYINSSNNNNNKSLSLFLQTLETNIQPKPLGLCAQFVHWGLNVAGFYFQGKYSAKLYHLENLLKKLGFCEIPNNSILKRGDIAVIVDTKLVNNSNYYGHICAWDGNYWLCDNKEKNIFCKDINNIHYYRYNLWKE
jgi:hypothetical protein